MSSGLPIAFQELFQLPALGINPQSIGFSKVTMESDNFIAVRETTAQGGQVIILDTSAPHEPMRFPVRADAAIMHPSKKILALKAGQQLQIFDIVGRKKLKDHAMPEEVVFWRWVSETTIALVTATAVYHWSMEPNVNPQKMFDRHSSLSGCDIVNYRTDPAQKWLVLVGYAARGDQIQGAMQLYSVDRKMSQPIEGHACAFASFKTRGASAESTLFCFANRSAGVAKLFVIQVAKEVDTDPDFQRLSLDIAFPPEATGDFPVAMQVSNRYNVLYMITKFGYVYLFDVESGSTIYSNRISAEPVFVTVPHTSTHGILGINRQGQVLSVSVAEDKLVPFIASTGNVPLAIRIASRNNLPGADQLFQRQFEQLFAQGMYKEAARVAAESPRQVLRTNAIIQRFQQAPGVQGQATPVLQYFSVLLELGQLNKVESLELCRPVLMQGKAAMIGEWLAAKKLSCSEELGDLVRQHDLKLALQVYYHAEAKAKVVALFAELGQFDKIITYCQQVGYQPDWGYLLQLVLSRNPAMAVKFAQMLLNPPAEGQAPLVSDVNSVVDTFVQRGLVQETTSILYDVLQARGNRAEDAALQTRLLEVNLTHNHAQVADMLLGKGGFTHFDRARIAKLCEQAGLFQRALELYTAFADRKRVMLNTHAINPEFLVAYFSQLDQDEGMDVLRDMLRTNPRQNLAVVVEVAAKFSDAFEPPNLMALFDEADCSEGLFRYLNRIVNFSSDGEVHYKYIEAAAKMGQMEEVVRVCRESDHYDPERTKAFLMEARLPDQLPLLIVCDRFDYVQEMVSYLYKHNHSKYIEAYVQQINPVNTPIVVGGLLDADCNEDYIAGLLSSVGSRCPVAELVEEAEKRNRLKLLQAWLEARANEGSTEPATHNALAKIYVDLNRDPKEFLMANQYYDSRVVGAYCENRDPYLAYVAYRRGVCDDELITLTSAQGLFKDQARYLVERQDADLWAKVLTDDNEYKRNVIDQVVQTALPESKNPEEVSSTVKAFMTADLPNELIELLEKIVLESSEFSGNKNLQNLLILTAIRADKSKVMDYVKRLDKYDSTDIANIAIGEGLHEEAYTVFHKFGQHVDAVNVLVDHVNNVDRAAEYAEQVQEADVWSRLARAQLDRGLAKAAIDSYIKAGDNEYFLDVIHAANREGLHEDLIRFLQMCRTKAKNPTIESELAYAFAKTGALADLEDFINAPNSANIQDVGDRCFAEELYEAARILFTSISNYARLSSALVKLGKYSQAVEAARKANSLRSWKEVCFACVDADEFRLAQIAGLNIVIHADHLEEVVRHYENAGHWNEVISLLEQASGLERAHIQLFTALGILYSKFRPEKLMEHCKLFHAKMNRNKLIRVCEGNLQWREAVFLYIHNDEPDDAATTMMQHDADCWEHVLFKDVMGKCSSEVRYRGIDHYVRAHPTRAEDLCMSLVQHVDHTRVVNNVRKLGHLALIQGYLAAVQGENVAAVNEALNELHIEAGDYAALRESVDAYDAFDPVATARAVEAHELLEFRRIAAYLYKRNARFGQSVDLSKRDKLWQDAMTTAAASGDQDVAEGLARYFVENDMPECFAATLFTCYDLVRPDVALELAWRHKIIDFVMPFLVQMLREYIGKVDTLHERAQAQDAAQEQAAGGFGAEAGMPPGSVAPVGPMGGVPGGMMPPATMPPGMMMMPPGMMPPGTGMMPPGSVVGGMVPPGSMPMAGPGSSPGAFGF